MLVQYMLSLSVRVSVGLFVTYRYCIKMAKCRITHKLNELFHVRMIAQGFLAPMYDKNGKSERKFMALIATLIAQHSDEPGMICRSGCKYFQ